MAATVELSPHEIQGVCQRYLNEDQTKSEIDQNNNFQVVSYKFKSTSDAPAGYLGRHQFLSVEIALKDGEGAENLKKLRFFTKAAPADIASHMAYLEAFGVFKKEILVYTELLPKVQQIFPDIAPKCYYADNNLLVFENLTQAGFKMAAARDGLLNYEHLNCALKTLAAMHAGSIVYEVRQGKKLNAMHAAALVENAYPCDTEKDHMRVQNFDNANKVLTEFIKLMPKYREKLDYVLEHFPKRMTKIFELAQVSTKYQNVLLHADLWANNMMFSYGKFGEIPIQCRFVDFQLARYAPPMLDVITVLTIPTTRRFRAQYLAELVSDYYRFMTEFLKREALSIEDYLPREQFYESVDEFRLCGLIESCLFSHLTILPPELTQKLTGSADGFSDFFDRKRVEICLEAYKTDDTYRERLTDMIEDIVDNYVLK